MKHRILSYAATAAILWGCGTQRKVEAAMEQEMNATLSLPMEMQFRTRDIDTSQVEGPDTVKVNFDGHEMLMMRAVKDETTGEMVARGNIPAAVVSARFRHVAERHGRVVLCFEIVVPREIQYPDWQLRFQPVMCIERDTVRLDRVYVTGPDYRRMQLKGYEQYDRFLSGIVSDSSAFIDVRNLELWIRRNLPQLYAFRTDSSYISDDEFSSCFGVTERQAVENYTSKAKIRSNERMKARKDEMFARYVKAPVEKNHIRVDTVLVPGDGDFIYRYEETFMTRRGLRKADVTVDGEVWRQDEMIWDLPPTEPLTFYISSLASLMDTSAFSNRSDTLYERGLQAIRDRDYEAAAVCLGPYGDVNTAISLAALDKDDSAEEILENLPETPKVKYLLALLRSREGDDSEAVRLYMEACAGEQSFMHRGNLDPEIATLITKYNLNNQ